MKLRALRSVAVAIAIFALLDPAISVERRLKPTVALLTEYSADDKLRARISDVLASQFTVVTDHFSGAAAVVAVRSLPPQFSATANQVAFAVVESQAEPRLDLMDVVAPATALLSSATPVLVRVKASNAVGRTVTFTLSAFGAMQQTTEREIASGAEVFEVPLTMTPTRTGSVPVTIAVELSESRPMRFEFPIDVHDTRWPVLFFDRRPSWMTTFVRRAVESDARFSVTSRVVTSRSVSLDAGSPPAALDDVTSLAVHKVIVTGAPEELTARDVEGLSSYMRMHGGSVLLLPDRIMEGPWQRLTATKTWEIVESPRELSVQLESSPGSALITTEIAWPAPLPLEARMLASAPMIQPFPPGADSTSATRVPLLWSVASGRGTLAVSGALDSWRFRDPDIHEFDSFWRSVVALLADGSSDPVQIVVPRRTVRPGEPVHFDVHVGSHFLRQLGAADTRRAEISGVLTNQSITDTISFTPSVDIGTFQGSIRAPDSAGVYQIEVNAEGHNVTRSILVTDAGSLTPTTNIDALELWTSARGGRVIEESAVNDLADAIAAVVPTNRSPQLWHPMRSPWWILPFALALGTEWWMRRRQGLH